MNGPVCRVEFDNGLFSPEINLRPKHTGYFEGSWTVTASKIKPWKLHVTWPEVFNGVHVVSMTERSLVYAGDLHVVSWRLELELP